MQETRGSLSALSKSLYDQGPLIWRKLQHYRPYICPFERLLPLVPEGARVLDVGCGGGLFLALLLATGRRVDGLGLDVSSQAIELARMMSERFNDGGKGKVRFECVDVLAQWPGGRFDVVSVIDVMHHVPVSEQRGFLKRVCGAARQGGISLYKDMCSWPVWRAGMNRLHDLVVARQWIHYAPVEEVEKWARDEGMRLEHAEDINCLWYGHELRVFRKT